MSSADFFTIISGNFKSIEDAFKKAVKDAQLENSGAIGSIANKKYFVSLRVPGHADPLAFAKECAARHGNDFWNYSDGPAACVELKGAWLEKHRPAETPIPRGFKVFVFFGRSFLEK